MKTEHECCGKLPVRISFASGKNCMLWFKCQECGKTSEGKFSAKKATEAWNALFEQQAVGEFKSCPFCDAQPEAYPVPIDGDDDCYEVACVEDTCCVNPATGPCTTIEEAVRYWNTRHGEQQPAGEL